jgi:hypothetical protein
VSIPTDMIGKWRRPAETQAQVIQLRSGRHRQAPPVRLTRRGRTLLWGALILGCITAYGGLAWAVWVVR